MFNEKESSVRNYIVEKESMLFCFFGAFVISFFEFVILLIISLFITDGTGICNINKIAVGDDNRPYISVNCDGKELTNYSGNIIVEMANKGFKPLDCTWDRLGSTKCKIHDETNA